MFGITSIMIDFFSKPHALNILSLVVNAKCFVAPIVKNNRDAVVKSFDYFIVDLKILVQVGSK